MSTSVLNDPAPRRAPAVVVAILAGALSATVVVDVVAEQLAGRSVIWPVEAVARHLRATAWSTSWVLVVGIVAAVVGLSLLAVAAAPGRSGVVAIDADDDAEAAFMSRRSLQRALRTSAGSVDGVAGVDLRLANDRATVVVTSPFRDPGDLAGAVEAAVTAELARLRLSRPPVISVRARPAGGPS